MASFTDDTNQVKREFEAISTPTQIFIAALVALGIMIGVLLGLWLAVDPQDDADPPQTIEWNDSLYQLQGAGPEGEADDSPAGG
jgi:hypothetical protein